MALGGLNVCDETLICGNERIENENLLLVHFDFKEHCRHSYSRYFEFA